jgi:ABC-type phosphate/phosphonate transport system substrate-binding protein
MFAALPMYDRPENASAHDALWRLIRDGLRARGVPAPDALDRATAHMEGWARPDLTLGQICNLPWRAAFRDRVTLIAAADYGLPDTPPGHYRSVIVVRADDPARTLADTAGYRMAFNEPLSNSGWDMPQAHLRAAGITPRPWLRTGAHAASLAAVATARADLAAIDAITFRNLSRWDPAAREVRVIAQTHATPGMTFITSPGRDPAPFHAAIAEAIATLDPAAHDTLGLQGIATLPPSAYDIPLPPPPELPENRATPPG